LGSIETGGAREGVEGCQAIFNGGHEVGAKAMEREPSLSWNTAKTHLRYLERFG
jgi:hypothetical protein